MSAESSTIPDRRQEDPRIQKLINDVAETKVALSENTKITTEMKTTVDDVKDIVTSFKVLLKVSKFLTALAAAGAAAAAFWKQIKGGG